MSGNRRYVSGHTVIQNITPADREALSKEQHPFAAIVTCADSRVSPEIYFDQRLGEIFVIRNAGHVADWATLGAVEFAVRSLLVPLVVVVGHSGCAAIGNAFAHNDGFSGNLQRIINEIRPSIEGKKTIFDATCAHTLAVAKKIAESKAVIERQVSVRGAYYDIGNGGVSFIEEACASKLRQP